MNARTIGFTVGIIVGLIISVILLIICNNNSKVKTEYDERQQAIRGKSYKVGYYSMMIYLAALCVFFMSDIEIPFTLPVLAFLGIFIGILTMVVHSVWNGAYWGLNNDKRKYYIIFTIAIVINFASAIVAMFEGEFFLGFQGPVINLLCGIMCLIVIITIFIRDKIVKKDLEDDSEDEEE